MKDKTEESNRKKAYLVQIGLTIYRNIPTILNLILLLCIAILIVFLAPYVSGEQTLDHPWTTSQLTAAMLFLLLFMMLRSKR